MLIQIDKLKRRPRQIEIDEQASDFLVLKELVEQGTITFNNRISGVCKVAWAGDTVDVVGELMTTVAMPCSRCLKPVVNPLTIPVELTYVVDVGEGEIVGEDLEVPGEELGLIAYSGPEIDLRPDLEQEVVMALPQRPLCKEACRGLCPVCGSDLNQKTCSCEPSVFHSGLAALKDFKVKQ